MKKQMTKKIIFLILIFLSINVFGQTADELNEQSKKLIEQQKFEEAIPILKKLAGLGNAEAQYNLGYCYRSGAGVEQNTEKGIEWFAKSAEQGFNDGLYQMMMVYGNGDGVEQDYKKAFDLD
ncbi:tetratricopeptide repeat protein [Galbibacter sp. BG1]|uniref:tetratricopeptide repeat protein n=1 Tax=Galbibacter sp. BG1 TaxID=1170699 RepID=UPI0021054E22|nr:tetratricopeptide repeat protein [Galbibacter sp. BG1]